MPRTELASSHDLFSACSGNDGCGGSHIVNRWAEMGTGRPTPKVEAVHTTSIHLQTITRLPPVVRLWGEVGTPAHPIALRFSSNSRHWQALRSKF